VFLCDINIFSIKSAYRYFWPLNVPPGDEWRRIMTFIDSCHRAASSMYEFQIQHHQDSKQWVVNESKATCLLGTDCVCWEKGWRSYQAISCWRICDCENVRPGRRGDRLQFVILILSVVDMQSLWFSLVTLVACN